MNKNLVFDNSLGYFQNEKSTLTKSCSNCSDCSKDFRLELIKKKFGNIKKKREREKLTFLSCLHPPQQFSMQFNLQAKFFLTLQEFETGHFKVCFIFILTY